MIRSMTGFGREHRIIGGREILVEIRSVNSRYYEFISKLPRSYMYLEEKLKTLLKGQISRGKVELSLSICNVEGKETQVTVNPTVVEGYVTALRGISERYGLKDDLALSNVFQMTDAFNVMRAEVDEEEIWQAVSEVASAALDKFVAMRETEGAKMKADILEKLANVEEMVKQAGIYSPENVVL